MDLRSTYRRCRFWQKIIYSDEAHFDFGGYVNKQNCCIWATANPHAYIRNLTHLKRVIVWCGYCPRGRIGPFSFKKEQEEAVTVNVNRYRTMLNEFLFTNIEEKDIGNIWFQQDGATCHTVCILFFQDYIISCGADVVWPPRSCDLTPLDYYMWGAVKDKYYAGKPETIDALDDNIREAIGEIQLHTIMCLKIGPIV